MAVVVPDLPDLFEEAYQRAGLELRTGNDLRNARRSFNILTMEWQNRGLNLWTIEAGTQAITAGTSVYTLPADTVDLVEHQIRTGTGVNQIDTNLTRVSVSTYAQQSAKNTTGKPTQIFIQRLSASTTITLWPVPDASYTVSYYRIAGIDGLAAGEDTESASARFVPYDTFYGA